MRRRVARSVIAAGAGSCAVVLLAACLVLVASAGAPAPVDRRPLDYDDRPAGVVKDAIHNLGAAEYAYEMRVVDAGRPGTDGGAETMLVQSTEIDNGARRYRSAVADPAATGPGGPRVRFYSEGLVGYQHTPSALGGHGWEQRRRMTYDRIRNAFSDSPPRNTSATVVSENATTYVARITDPVVAVDVGHPGYSNPFIPFGRTRPPLDNVTANLTVTINKDTGHITRAVLRYHNPDPGGLYERDPTGPRTSVVTYEFSGYGATTVGRPLLTHPPDPRTMLYRLDLGFWALTEGHGWTRVATAVGRLVLAGLLVSLAAVGGRRVRSSERVTPRDWTVAALERAPVVDSSPRLGSIESIPSLDLGDAVEPPTAVADHWPAGDDPVDWEGYARVANRWYAAFLSTCWLLAVAVVVASAAVGPAPGPDATDAPAVDLDAPPDEVTADAVAQFQYRSHDLEYWWRDRNRTDGSIDGGIAVHLRVQHSARRVRVQVYRSVIEEGWTEPDDFHLDFYGTSATRHQRVGPGGAWRRTRRGGFVYRGYGRFHFWDADTFRGANETVRRQNGSALVVAFTDPEVVEDVAPSVENATGERVTVVVRKQPSPHLARVTYRGRTDSEVVRRTYRVSGVGETTVERPERAPPAPVTGWLHRTGQGFWRIVG